MEELEKGSTPEGNEDIRDELDKYLAQPLEGTGDPLQWWTERAPLFPRLSRMARDYLSIPGMFSSTRSDRVCASSAPFTLSYVDRC